jgi:hypothetical protein
VVIFSTQLDRRTARRRFDGDAVMRPARRSRMRLHALRSRSVRTRAIF